MKNISLKKNREKGFTLIETLIAITILMISVAAPLSLASKGLQAANLAKNQIVAYYLAQDAYEWVKNKTDMNKIKNIPYGGGGQNGMIDGLDDCSSDTNSKCIINTLESPDITSAVDRYTGQKLKVDNGVYSYGASGQDSIFKRYIHVERVDRGDASKLDEALIQVTVE